MTFFHASAGVNALDCVYSLLVAFVLTGVVFAVLRILPRPLWIRGRLLAAKIAAAVLLGAGALAFGAIYTGLVSPQSAPPARFIP